MKKIVILTAVLAMVFGGTALAADYSFYGNARMAMWSINQDKDWSANPLTNQDDYRTTSWDLQDNSRFGAKASAGDISANVEMGYFIDAGSNKQAFRVRHLNARWNFGAGDVLVGQAWAPTVFFPSNQVAGWDNGFLSYGAPAMRVPQVTFRFSGFTIGLLSPNTSTGTGAPGGAATQATLPKIEVKYLGTFGPMKLHVAGGWNSVNDVSATNNTVSVTSYLFNAMLTYAAGPFKVTGAFAYGVNGGQYDNSFGAVDDDGNWSGTEFKDNTAWAGQLVFGYTVNDMVGLELGYAYVTSSDDGATNDDTAQSYYFQVPLTLADGVFIVPEFTVFDKMENAAKAKEGQEQHIGAKFQINF